jgi:hypothetical protein
LRWQPEKRSLIRPSEIAVKALHESLPDGFVFFHHFKYQGTGNNLAARIFSPLTLEQAMDLAGLKGIAADLELAELLGSVIDTLFSVGNALVDRGHGQLLL